uniref:G protein gamma domain-containing protein n=1 Tax=Steinernema glaseri TaxID=37863 RepID=A0A1I8AUE8_9BILA
MDAKKTLPPSIPIASTPYEKSANHAAVLQIRIDRVDKEILELKEYLLKKKKERLAREAKIAVLRQVDKFQDHMVRPFLCPHKPTEKLDAPSPRLRTRSLPRFKSMEK